MTTLKEFQEACTKRRKESYPGADSHDLTWWTNAMAGEVGEACNVAKKLTRGRPEDAKVTPQDLADELGDVVAYAAAVASYMGIDFEKAVSDKFNAVSKRVGSGVVLK